MNSFIHLKAGESEDIFIMILSKVSVSDGIDLSLLKTDKFKSGIFTFRVSVPYTARNAVLGQLLSCVLKRGTSSYPDLASLSRRLDELYASSADLRCAKLGKNLILTVTSDIIDQKYVPDSTDLLGGVLEIVYETLTCPHLENGYFPEKIFEQEKRFLTSDIDAAVNNTRAYAGIRLNELMFASDPEYLTIEHTKEILKEIDNKALTDFFNDHVKCAPISVFYVGSLDGEFIKSKLIEQFGDRGFSNAVSPCMPYAEPVLELRSKEEKMPVSQGKLALGFKTSAVISEDGDKHYALMLMNEIFGGSPASKLFMNVREKMGLCYYCSSHYNQYSGILTVSSGIDSSNRKKAQKAILKELENIRDGKISDVEIHAAKASLENSYRQLFDNPYDLQSSYGNKKFFGFTDSIEVSLSKVLGITKAQVAEVAKTVVLDSVFFVEGNKDGEEDNGDE